jgi:hypothetical protein
MGVIVTDGRLGGIQATIWVKNIKLIDKLIGQYKLKVTPDKALPTLGFAPTEGLGESVAGRAALKRSPVRIPPFPGGIRVPHFHFKGEIYFLDEKQWRDFSSQTIKILQDKLSRAKAVSFENLVELTEAVEGLP